MNKKILLIIIIVIILIVIGVIGTIFLMPKDNNDFSSNESENILQNNVNENVLDNETTNNIVNKSQNEVLNEEIEDNIVSNIESQKTSEEPKVKQSTSQKSQNTNNNSNNSKPTNNKETTTNNSGSSGSSESSTTSSPSPVETPETKPIDNKQEQIKPTESTVERCTNNSNHSIGVGNSNQWYSSKSEAISAYDEKVKYWSDLWESNQIDNDTYYKNCPYGYEVWDCMYCGKWTINYYYR